MSCILIFEQGNAPIIETVVLNALTGLPINDATVEVVVTDAAGAQVTGETWPAALSYVAGSNGVYRRQLSDALGVVTGQPYKATLTISASGSDDRTLVYDVVVTDPGCGAVLPHTSTASPAYAAPTTQTLLNDAKAAYHRLQMGTSARVVVDYNGERVEYTAANRVSLAQYIQSLETQLNGISYGRVSPGGAYF